MAYCIGNGAATIGGGSLGRTEQLPTLKLLCVDLCARWARPLLSTRNRPSWDFREQNAARTTAAIAIIWHERLEADRAAGSGDSSDCIARGCIIHACSMVLSIRSAARSYSNTGRGLIDPHRSFMFCPYQYEFNLRRGHHTGDVDYMRAAWVLQ